MPSTQACTPSTCSVTSISKTSISRDSPCIMVNLRYQRKQEVVADKLLRKVLIWISYFSKKKKLLTTLMPSKTWNWKIKCCLLRHASLHWSYIVVAFTGVEPRCNPITCRTSTRKSANSVHVIGVSSWPVRTDSHVHVEQARTAGDTPTLFHRSPYPRTFLPSTQNTMQWPNGNVTL